MVDVQNFIRGELCPAQSGATIQNINPATGQVSGAIPDSGADDVSAAVSAAEAAFPAWSQLPAEQRAAAMNAIADGIAARLDEFAKAESDDAGKPIARVKAVEIPRAVQNFRYFAAAIQHEKSEFYETGRAAWNCVLRRPRGVAGVISPWNLPLYLLSWKIAPAMAVGCTVVAKPSEVTPVTAHLLCEVMRDANLPAGVVNIVHGRGATAGKALVDHLRVKTISFTGGTTTGRTIAQSAAASFKKVSLEMGGKNPTIVFADAADDVVMPTVMAAFANTGQICLCGSRVLIERSKFDDFSAKFVAAAKQLRVGPPADEQTQIGPLVSAAQLEKTESYVQLARDEGGTIQCGGERPRELPSENKNGFFFEPTVVTGLSMDCRTNQEEIFGPMTALIPFDTVDEAIELANATNYGLSASVWTKNYDHAMCVSSALESGTVWVNTWLLRDLRVPFGGMKESGLGREGGDEALRFFTEPKTICFAQPE